MCFFDKINNYTIVDVIKEIFKGWDPEESLSDSVSWDIPQVCDQQWVEDCKTDMLVDLRLQAGEVCKASMTDS